MPERVKLPPAPKAPEPPSGIAAGAADALGSVLGIETAHQRAMKAHAEAMKQWRQMVKDLRRQDATAPGLLPLASVFGIRETDLVHLLRSFDHVNASWGCSVDLFRDSLAH